MRDDDYIPKEYIIPPNISDNGNVFKGRLKMKNVIEAIIVFLFTSIIWKILSYPFGMIGRTVAFVFMVLPLTCLAIIGLKNESFFEFLLEIFFFRKKRRKLKFRIPMNVKAYEPEDKKTKKKKAEETKVDATEDAAEGSSAPKEKKSFLKRLLN